MKFLWVTGEGWSVPPVQCTQPVWELVWLRDSWWYSQLGSSSHRNSLATYLPGFFISSNCYTSPCKNSVTKHFPSLVPLLLWQVSFHSLLFNGATKLATNIKKPLVLCVSLSVWLLSHSLCPMFLSSFGSIKSKRWDYFHLCKQTFLSFVIAKADICVNANTFCNSAFDNILIWMMHYTTVATKKSMR